MTWHLYPKVKRPEHEAGHLPPSDADVRNELSCTSTPRCDFVAWRLSTEGKHRQILWLDEKGGGIFYPDLWHSLWKHIARVGIMGQLINYELERSWKCGPMLLEGESPR